MNANYELTEALNDSFESQCARAVYHTAEEDRDTAGCILSEWTLNNNDCVLTNYLNETTSSIEEELMYIRLDDQELTWGSFSFIPNV